jgi:N4-(beta-N-acetylglucosaminyl)-L-asparaginase
MTSEFRSVIPAVLARGYSLSGASSLLVSQVTAATAARTGVGAAPSNVGRHIMTDRIDRRDFLRNSLVVGAAVAAAPASAFGQPLQSAPASATPAVHTRRRAAPKVIADFTGFESRGDGRQNAVEKAFEEITGGTDVLDALIAGVNIPERDPEETGVGYGGLPNADGIVQLDASCMHGPRRRAGGVAALEGVRTPSLVAKAVMDLTDHHLLVGAGAQDFARQLGFTIEDDLNTETTRRLWLEWRRRVDPDHWLDPARRGASAHIDPDRGYAEGMRMVAEGLISEESYWGTIHCSGINANGDICAVTTTSGLSWKIPGRTGDSPIIGARLNVDNEVGAAGSTGRGEANLYNLCSYLIVENLRRGMTPKDAGMDALRRIRTNTVERRLLNARGLPNFNVRFFVLNKNGEHAGVAMYASGEARYALCTANGAESPALEPLLEGGPAD